MVVIVMQLEDLPLSRREFVLATGATSAMLAGCIGGNGSDDEQVLRVGLESDPRTIDPVRHLSTPDRQVLNNVFNNIVALDNDLAFAPELAVDLPETEQDGARWIVEIDSDAEFHNGEPVTFEDVEYSMTQPVVEDRGDAGDYNMIESIEEVDEHTIQFDLEEPYARFMLSLNTLVVPKDVREENKGAEDEWAENIIGSGPYKFVEWDEGERVLLEKNEDYWMDIDPGLDEVEILEIEEASTRVTTLETDETDLIQEVPTDLQETVNSMDHSSMEIVQGLRCNFIAFNCIDGPTADPLVREGIDACIDLDNEIDLQIGDGGERMFSPIPSSLAEEWDLPVDEWAEIPAEKDHDRAAELLDEGGLDPDYELDILVSGDDTLAVSLANEIEAAGYSANVQNLEWGTFISTFNSGDADDMNIYFLGLSGAPDPGAFINTLYHPSREGADNGHYYRDDELLEWMEGADATADEDERRELFIDSVTRVLEERVHLPTYEQMEAWGVADHVNDFQLNPRPSINPRLTSEWNNVGIDR